MESLGTFRKCIESQCCARRRSISVVSSSLQVTVEPNNQTNIVQKEQRFRRQDHMPAFHHHELLHIWIFSLSCPNNKKQSLDILDLFVPHWRSSIERKISPRLSASMPVTAFVLRGVDVSFSPTAVVYMKSNRENWIRDALYKVVVSSLIVSHSRIARETPHRIRHTRTYYFTMAVCTVW